MNDFVFFGQAKMKSERQQNRKQHNQAARFFRAAMIVGLLVASGPVRRAQAQSSAKRADSIGTSYQETTDDYNRRLADITRSMSLPVAGVPPSDYRIGPDDQLDISVLEAPELGCKPRVSARGEISLALVGTVRAAGLTPQELEVVIAELLRRNYINDPHVSVQLGDIQSHPVAVFGAVKKPGVFQIRGPKTVVELLSMAEGLDVDAGDMVIVEHRGAGVPAAKVSSNSSANDSSPNSELLQQPEDSPAHAAPISEAKPAEDSVAGLTNVPSTNEEPGTEQVDLKRLLATGDPRLNVMVYPGDVVKVPRAELVYVVGEVARPGGFELKSNENISILQAVALAQGLTHTSASSKARIIRTNAETGQRQEIPINLNKVLAGQIADPILEPRDIVFVPNSVGRTALYRSVDAALTIGSGVAIYRW
jgi:polysaccharide export outer membrane protein